MAKVSKILILILILSISKNVRVKQIHIYFTMKGLVFIVFMHLNTFIGKKIKLKVSVIEVSGMKCILVTTLYRSFLNFLSSFL